jgi:hypothetical protein
MSIVYMYCIYYQLCNLHLRKILAIFLANYYFCYFTFIDVIMLVFLINFIFLTNMTLNQKRTDVQIELVEIKTVNFLQ